MWLHVAVLLFSFLTNSSHALTLKPHYYHLFHHTICYTSTLSVNVYAQKYVHMKNMVGVSAHISEFMSHVRKLKGRWFSCSVPDCHLCDIGNNNNFERVVFRWSVCQKMNKTIFVHSKRWLSILLCYSGLDFMSFLDKIFSPDLISDILSLTCYLSFTELFHFSSAPWILILLNSENRVSMLFSLFLTFYKRNRNPG